MAYDSREQLPYHFGPGVRVERATLPEGDYAIADVLADRVAVVERKSYADFYGCLTSSRKRFERELERLAAWRFPLVIVEGAWSEEFAKPYMYRKGGAYRRSLVPPIVAKASVLAWMQRYRVPFLPVGADRAVAAATTLQHLGLAWKVLGREYKMQQAADAVAR